MRSKVAKRILSMTKEDVRQQVRNHVDMILKTEEMIELHKSSDSSLMTDQYISIVNREEESLKRISLAIDNPYHRFKGSRYFYLWAYLSRKREKIKLQKVFDMQEVLNRLHDFK